MAGDRTTSVAPRLHSLDGLRGVAALIVVFHHSLLLIPALAAPYFDRGSVQEAGPLAWLMTYTPLHLLWEGKAAVYLFFVLSGIVLTLPVLNAERFNWKAYYPQRLLRLYLPVWGAVVFGVIMIAAVPRVGLGISEWLGNRPDEASPTAILLDTTLVADTGGLISPLWSLQWEVLFSLALPLFAWVAMKFRNLLAVKATLTLGMVAIAGAVGNEAVFYLLMFLVGAVLATEMGRLRGIGSRIDLSAHPRLVWWSVLGGGLMLIYSYWFMSIFEPPAWILGGSRVIMLIGTVVVIFAAACWPGMGRLLQRPALKWLGLVSFSLYLIHEPIIVASGFLFGPSLLWLAIPAGIVASLLFTVVFYRGIERPSHLLAQAVKRSLSAPAVPVSPPAPPMPVHQDRQGLDATAGRALATTR